MNAWLERLEWWHVALAVVVGGLAWRSLGAPGDGPIPVGDEDIQRHVTGYGLPSDFMHWSPVSWVGRAHPWPTGIGENVGELIYCGPPDYADSDGWVRPSAS